MTVTPTGRSATPVAAPANPAAVVAVLSSVGLVASLCMTLVVPIVPQLPALLDTSTATASWVITSTLLAGAVATPLAGRLGDMVGKRAMLLVTMALLIAGSVLCAVTSDLVPVLVGRVLQGVAVSAVPLGISLMRDALPPERLGSGIALMSATLGIGGGLGLPLAALIVQVTDWHALFWVAGGLGLVGAALVRALVPETSTRSGGRFDLVGALGLSVGLVCLLLAISKGHEWGFASARTLGLAGGAVVVLLLWGWWELRVTDPVVDLRISARRGVLVPNLISIPVGVAMLTGIVVYPQLLSAPTVTGFGLGLSLIATGLVLAPNGVVMMLMSPVTARVSARFGPRAALRIGLVVIVAAYAAGSVLTTSWWQVSLVIAVVGAGVALSYGSLPALIMRAVPTSKTAAANGLNTLMRSLGTSAASAVAAVVLSAEMVSVGDTAVPSVTGIRITLLVAGGAAVVALVGSLAVPLLPEQDVPEAVGVEVGEPAGRPRVDVGVGEPAGRLAGRARHVDRRPAVGVGEPAGRLAGRARHVDRRPAVGARVTAVSLAGRQLAVTTTDDDGWFALDPGAADTVLLIVSHPQARPVAVHVGPGGRPHLVLTLPTGDAARRGSITRLEGPVAGGRALGDHRDRARR